MAKTMKRLLCAVLALAMCMSMLCVPAFAEEATADFPIKKTATALDKNDQTDVTLTVPGTVEGYIDVVFVLGGGMTANMKTIESAISVFEPAMESGKATVRMGLISLEKGKEIILDLNSDEAVLDRDTYVDFVTEKFDSINDLPYGSTNLHSQLVEAKKMLAKETKAKAENKYVFVLATGRTYWFDDANGEQATIVNKVNGTYYWGDYLWKSQRGRHTSLYMIPDRYDNSYEAFFTDVEKWVADDGDKYVYTPHFDVNDYSAYVTWEQNNNKDLRTLGIAGSRYGNGIVNPKPTAENFITGIPAAIGSENHPLHALNYERAQYECVQVWKDLVAAGYNCYSICSENPNYQNGSEYIKLGAKYTGTSTIQVGHSFMNYLATLAGHDEAPTVWDYERDAEGNMLSTKTVLRENFFDVVRDDMLYTTSIGSTVKDFIGKNENGNFEFITDANTIKLVVGGVEYSTTELTETNEDADNSYEFKAPGAEEPTFWLDYYYGNGETTERFVWTFGENVSMERLASLTYKLQLKDKKEEAGDYTVPTNNSATLYPVDSDGKDGDPQIFPVPTVEYSVVPYDVDIVLALGAGIAQYDADSTKGTNTYDAIVNLVEPLVEAGINVKLGLIPVEHYTERFEKLELQKNVLIKDTYKDVIQANLEYIQTLPAGPTNLEAVITAAHDMLAEDDAVPAENKFFHVIATGRTYCFDDSNGEPATIINKLALKGNTYYYWGHYLWQSQRGRHTSLYMIPDRYNNNFEAYWADVCKWVEKDIADGDKYVYTMGQEVEDIIDFDGDPNWYVGNEGFFTKNSTDAKALKLASSRYGWILTNLTNTGLDAIGSGANPENALNYERGQYDAYKAFQKMKEAGYNCYALCSENTSYQNGSPYIQIAKYTGTSTIQLGHSFMNFLNGGEAPLLFVMTDPNTGASEMAKNFYAPVDVTKLVKSTEDNKDTSNGAELPKIPMFSAGPKGPRFLSQPVDVEGALGETVSVCAEFSDPDATYQWYFKNAGAKDFSKSSTKTATYEVEMTKERAGRQVYCVVTDVMGNKYTSNTATLIRVAAEELAIDTQPVDAEGALGETVTVKVEAKGEGLKYRWYFKDAGASAFSASSITTDTYEVEMTKARAGRELYCVITDVVGNKVTTDTVKLIRVAAEELVIDDQPIDAEGALGETVSVSVKAKGEGLKYRWYFKDAGASKFSASSITTDTYEVELTKTRAGRELYCVITDALGNTATTDTVKLIRVAAEELVIEKQPEDAEGEMGELLTITVEAKGEGLKYQWYFCNAGDDKFYASSIKTDTYEAELNESRVDRQVYCVITDALGNTVESDIATLLLAEEEPADLTGEIGDEA